MPQKTNLPVANTNTAVSVEENRRQEILSAANAEFVEKYETIREQLVAEEKCIFESRYKVGGLIAEMRNEENKYGSKSVERMEVVVGYDRSVIYNSLLFFERYTEAEMKDLLELRTKAGQPLLWTHVTHLIRIPDRVVRKQMQDLILETDFTPAELLAHIQKREGGKKNPNAGKPLARPKSLKGFIDQQTAVLEQLLNRKMKVWAGRQKPTDKSFFDVLTDTPTDKIDDTVLTNLANLQEKYEYVSRETDQMATELLQLRKRFAREKFQPDDTEEDESGTDEPIDDSKLFVDDASDLEEEGKDEERDYSGFEAEDEEEDQEPEPLPVQAPVKQPTPKSKPIQRKVR